MTENNLEKNIRDCPFAKFEAWDAMISTEGDYVCQNTLNPNEPGEYGGPSERPNCLFSNYNECKWYLMFFEKK
jgi:hypothetical protein